MPAPEICTSGPDGLFPNSRLPALIYRGALAADADAMIATFAANGWSNAWIDGIFSYHHFHSNAHEVLGIASGEVQVTLGGPAGETVSLSAGDVVAIPAGVAHRNVGQSAQLVVVGAYPGGEGYDLKRGEGDEYEAAAKSAAMVSPLVPDPVTGEKSIGHGAWNATG